jgi:gamma-glutamyl hydrolase
MMIIGLLFTILAISQIYANDKIRHSSAENTRPIIGILTQPTPSTWLKPNRTTYIAASYVKYLEATGVQVVPIRMYQSIDYYLHLFNSLNGVLFPGGDFSDEYLYVAKLFYIWSLKEFDEMQRSFPLWGTCLGFEVLFMLTRSSTDVLEQCQGYDFATELTFMPDAANSRLLGTSLPVSVKNALENEPTTSNYHNFCMRPENFTADPVISTFYKMLTTSPDLAGRRFVSTIESRRYPIFGVQWHPEKNAFEWRENTTIPHTKDAVQVMQYMANFFADQGRQNTNHFDSLEDEVENLIYQYTPEFMNLDKSHFQQLYFFN